MSGKPYPEGVSETIKLMDSISKLDSELQSSRKIVKDLLTREKEIETELNSLNRKYEEIMRAMDLVSEGNFGFPQRARWFLAELRRQVVEENKK